MLKVEALNAWYGPSHVLQGIDLEIRRGEIVCLIGRNGAGKTTTLKSILGLIPKTTGSVVFEGKELRGRPAHLRYGAGLAYVPEDLAEPHLKSGRLVRVLDEWCPYWPGYHLYYPSRRQPSPAFSMVLEALRHRG